MTYSDDAIRRRLDSKNPDARRVAAVMIGKARHYDYVEDLTRLLIHDIDTDVRAMAAFALDLLGSVDAVPALVEALYDHSFDVRSNAGWALAHIAKRVLPQLVIPDLIDVLQDEEHPRAQQMAYLVLSRIPDDTARDASEGYLD